MLNRKKAQKQTCKSKNPVTKQASKCWKSTGVNARRQAGEKACKQANRKKPSDKIATVQESIGQQRKQGYCNNAWI